MSQRQLYNFPTVAEASLGFSIAVALCPLRQRCVNACVSKRHLHPGHVQVQQAVQVFDIVNGRPQSLHFAEPPVLELVRQMLPEPRVALVYAAYSVSLSLVPLPDERGLEGVIAHAEGSVKGEIGQPSVGQHLAVHRVEVRGVQVQGQSEAKRIFEARSALIHADALERHRGDAWNVLH